MRDVIVYRNGEERLRVPAEIRNGILRSGINILINNDLIPPDKLDWVKNQIKAHNINSEIEAMGMRIGDNGNGLIVRWADEVVAELRAQAQAEYNALPAEVRAAHEERNKIWDMFRRAHKALNYDTDDDNVSRGYGLQAEAKARLKAWRAKYPKEAMREDAQDLLDKASEQEEFAVGALVYDADGWINPDEQQRSHDEFLAAAGQLRADAAKLLEQAKEDI